MLPINQILCGDCLEVMRDWPDNCVDLIFTSPPYNTGNSGKNKDMYTDYNDNLTFEQYYNLLMSITIEGLRVCKGLVFVNLNFMRNNTSGILKYLHKLDYCFREIISWDKQMCQPPIGNILAKRCEYIFVFDIGQTVINDFRNNLGKKHKEVFGPWISNHITINLLTDQTEFSRIHRAGFPVKLPYTFIDIYTKPNDIILDPFNGLASTCVAAKMLGRRYIGIDISEKYCQIARQRLEAVDTGVPVKEQQKGQQALFPMDTT